MSELKLKIAEEGALNLYDYIEVKNYKKGIFQIAEVDESLIDITIPLIEDYLFSNPKHDTITLDINSTGGCVFSGMAFINFIQHLAHSGIKININVRGNAMSMGALIAITKHPNITRTAMKSSVFLLHKGELNVNGNTNQVKDFFAFQEEYDNILKNHVLQNCNITEEEYKNIERYEKFYTGTQALEKNMVDKLY